MMKLKEKEIAITEFRQYDTRLNRWSSIDPLASTFPWQFPYVGFDNNPIFVTTQH